jgi:hypothetical protein
MLGKGSLKKPAGDSRITEELISVMYAVLGMQRLKYKRRS